MTQLPNHEATLAQSDHFKLALQTELLIVLNTIAPRATALYSEKTYIALEDTIIENVAEDLGVVRASAVFSCRYVYTHLYRHQATNKKPDLDQIAQFEPVDFYTVVLTISVPLFGLMTASARIKSGSNKVDQSSFVVNTDGAIGTLWFNSAIDIIAKVKNKNLLASPQFKKAMEV